MGKPSGRTRQAAAITFLGDPMRRNAQVPTGPPGDDESGTSRVPRHAGLASEGFEVARDEENGGGTTGERARREGCQRGTS